MAPQITPYGTVSEGPCGGKGHSDWQDQGRHSPVLSSWVSSACPLCLYVTAQPAQVQALAYLPQQYEK